MKQSKAKTKSYSKLKCPEKKLNTKISTNNIKNPINKKYIPESSSNKKSKDFLIRRIKHTVIKQEKKRNKEKSNFSYSKEKEKEKIKEPIKKLKKCFQENQLLLNINNVNTTNNNNIYNINNTNSNTNITQSNTNSQNELLTNPNNINNKISHNFSLDEKILLKINKIRLKYEKKLQNDTLEIKSLTEKNDRLEELVLKLKETLDKANEMFPDFLEQIISTKCEKERQSNRSNEIEGLKEENKKIKNDIKNNEQLIQELKKENENLILENNALKIDIKNINAKNNEINTELNTIKKNLENKIKNIKDSNEKEICVKINENKKLNEIITDQEKVITELKEIIHKNNDKINDLSQKNGKLREDLDKTNWFNKSKLDQINKEIEELSKNYIKKVESYNELQKKYDLIKSNIFADINTIKQNAEKKTIKQIQEDINKIKDNINILLISENNKDIMTQIINALEQFNNNFNKDINISNINEEINSINKEIKIIESFKGKFEQKISELIHQNEKMKENTKENYIQYNTNNFSITTTNFTTISKKRKEEESLNIFTEENIKDLEEKSNSSLEERVIKKINFSESEGIYTTDKEKDNIIKQLKEEIINLKKNKTLVDDEEFNELVDENEELKKLNKNLMQQLAEINSNSNINQKKILLTQKNAEKNDEIFALREKLEEVYRQLNEYRLKNSELNKEIKEIKNIGENNICEKDEITLLLNKLKNIENENMTLKQLLKQNNIDL